MFVNLAVLDFSQLQVLIDGLQNKDAGKVITEKDMLQTLCELASSEKDRCITKYTVCTSSQLSSSSAKNIYGVLDLAMLKRQVTQALDEAREIREVVKKIASKEKSIALERLSLVIFDSGESSDSSSDGEESLDDLTDNDDKNSEWLPDDTRACSRSTGDSGKHIPEENRHIDPDKFSKNAAATCNPVPSYDH